MQEPPAVVLGMGLPLWRVALCAHPTQLSRIFFQPNEGPSGLKPLAGVHLPKTEIGWREMNASFHSGPLFRYASGKIGDLDLAAAEFNLSIYEYLKGKFGTLRATDLSANTDNRLLDQKYQGWSQSRVRRALEKLKRRGPIIQGSPLCDEIRYLSHRLSSELKIRSSAKKSATDKDFVIGFWPA